ncbi:MAG: hypothetical protein ACRD5K_09015 [Candidatus Acidiferrales bacterium]
MAASTSFINSEIAELAATRNCRRGRESIAIQVAGQVFGLFAESTVGLALGKELAAFAVDADSCDVRMTVNWTREMNLPRRRPLFESGGLWSVYQENGGYRFFFSTSALGDTPYKSAWFDEGFAGGCVQLFQPYFDASRAIYPLEYPLDELVMIHRLARGEGVEIHGLGVVDDAGRGHLFIGHSGAGKSTLARLWQQESRALILSDDRIILRERDGRIWMHGTPWHGDAGIASPQAAPLHRAYLIEHGGRTEFIDVTKGRAAAELLARCFVPHYSADAMDFTLGFLARVAQETPCRVFRFLPDKSAVEAIGRASD